jgi:hypothetical protein
VTTSADAVRETRRRASSNGTKFWLTSYLGPNRYTVGASEPPGPGTVVPVAFLVEQDPGEVVGAHYHQADQFQVMVAGGGRLGTHDVAPGSVHFAGAWSAYGPLRAGAEGLSYFTLRNGWDPGARYMEFPDVRAGLRAVPRRHREVVGETHAAAPDGFCVRRMRIAPGARETGPNPAGGAGQFWIVLSGSLRVAGAIMPAMSCAFVHPDEAALAVVADAPGAEILVMQFPRVVTAPRQSAATAAA